MPDIHAEKFHEATQDKLNLLVTYFREWLPVFTVSKHYNQVLIADLFAGEGYDAVGNLGSPLLLLKEVKILQNLILVNDIQLIMVFNELDYEKFNRLKQNVTNFIDCNFSTLFKHKLQIEFRNKCFSELWKDLHKYTKETKLPSFVFLDQYGVKDVSDEIFLEVCQLKKCDFAFFLSSSFVKRFISRPEFNEKFRDIEEKIQECSSKESHVIVFEHYKEIVKQTKLSKRIFPFSIKKNSNYYGLIFGSEHILGIEKIVKAMWDNDPVNGSANFDLYDDSTDGLDLFNRYDIKFKDTRIDKFENSLKKKLLDGKLKTNIDIYVWTLEKQFLPKHAKDCLLKLRKNEIISFQGQPKISYNAYKRKDEVNFNVVENSEHKQN